MDMELLTLLIFSRELVTTVVLVAIRKDLSTNLFPKNLTGKKYNAIMQKSVKILIKKRLGMRRNLIADQLLSLPKVWRQKRRPFSPLSPLLPASALFSAAGRSTKRRDVT